MRFHTLGAGRSTAPWLASVLLLASVWPTRTSAAASESMTQRAYLNQLRAVLPQEHADRGGPTPLDATWSAWLERTGELPPDFSRMPSLPFLPDPLVLDEGAKNVPVRTAAQWREKRTWIAQQLQHWVTGTFPPRPNNLEAKVLGETKVGLVRKRIVELRFGPDHAAKLTLELYLPPGNGPFPVLLTPGGNGTSWIGLGPAVQRGYLGCLYAGCDAHDDTEAYASIWYPQYDFTRLMRRAWAAQRAIDYLETLSEVDMRKIGIAGLSRDGKQVSMAAAFDERIKATVVCSGGTGAEDPFRYTTDKFNNETISEITTSFPQWLHPRLRFFIGREDKLPVDQNLLYSLVAPRGLLISSSMVESQGNPWGIEQNYHSIRRVYQFVNADDQLGLDLRLGYHPPAVRDVENYVDFFDTIFGRGKMPVPRRLLYDYTFEKWQRLSGEKIDLAKFPTNGAGVLLVGSGGKPIATQGDWEAKKAGLQSRIRWSLGDEPPIPPAAPFFRDDYLREVIGQPKLKKPIATRSVWNGALFYPTGADGKPAKSRFPVVIYLHEYSYPTGYARRPQPIIEGLIDHGFAVFAYDQIGFGTLIEEGASFYQRYPHWSKLGRMIADARQAVDALAQVELVDAKQIYVAGYSLGATVGLYAAALDERIAGVVSVCGFTPLREAAAANGMEGARAFSHLHGLLPRLGFFASSEARIPYDYHELLACVSPRPILVIAPEWDRDASPAGVRQCVAEAQGVFRLCGAPEGLTLLTPDTYNQFSAAMRTEVFDWLAKR